MSQPKAHFCFWIYCFDQGKYTASVICDIKIILFFNDQHLNEQFVVKFLVSLVTWRQVEKGLMLNAPYMYEWGHALVHQQD